MKGLAPACRAEAFVARRAFSSRLIVLGPTLVVFLQYLLLWLSGAGSAAREQLLGDSGFDALVAANAWGRFVDGMGTGLTVLALLLVGQAAFSFSHERDTGAVRHALTRRVSRSSLISAKLICLHVLGLLSVLLLLISAWSLAGMLWEYGPVVEDGFELIGEAEIRRETGAGLLLAVLPLPAAIAFGLLVSVCARSATEAVTTALGVTLALDVFKTLLGEFRHYLWVTFQPSLLDQSYLADVGRIVRGYSDVLVEPRLLTLNVWVPWPTLMLFVALTLWAVQGRKL